VPHAAHTPLTRRAHAARARSTEFVLDAAVPLPGNTGKVKLLQKAGVKMNVLF
jgi:hypothetical protein